MASTTARRIAPDWSVDIVHYRGGWQWWACPPAGPEERRGRVHRSRQQAVAAAKRLGATDEQIHRPHEQWVRVHPAEVQPGDVIREVYPLEIGVPPGRGRMVVHACGQPCSDDDSGHWYVKYEGNDTHSYLEDDEHAFRGRWIERLR